MTYDWSNACAYVDPVLTGQISDISKSISTTRTNMFFESSFVLLEMLLSPMFSLA